MKAFNKIFMAVIGVLAILFAAANIILLADSSGSGRPYRVEINRLARQIETDGHADISDCKYVTGIEKYGGDFFSIDSDYAVREINGVLYRFDYRADNSDRTRLIVTIDVILGVNCE